jgi:hypothetical protein
MFKHTEINGVKYTAFSCLKASEGGMSQDNAMFLLDCEGIKSRKGCYTPYVGHYGLWVESGKRKERKAEKILFGI